MITTILDQISGLLGKAYAVSSLTPWLLFWLANAVTGLCLVGPAPVSQWWHHEVTENFSTFATLAAVVVVFFAGGALFMDGLYALVRRWLEEGSNAPGIRLVTRSLCRLQSLRTTRALARLEQAHLDLAIARQLQENVASTTREAIAASRAASRPAPSPEELSTFVARFHACLWDQAPAGIERARQQLVEAFANWHPEQFRDSIRELFEASESHYELSLVRATTLAERTGGRSAVTAAPSEYGETLASTSQYVSTRYGIDSIVMWSRLQPLLPPDHLAVVQDTKVRMDMLTALTVLSGVYAGAWFVVLPAYRVSWQVLTWTTGAGLVGMIVFYFASVDAARSFGETIRSSFDLYRHALLKQFGFDLPATPTEERKMWTGLSRQILYNDVFDLPYAREASAAEKPAADAAAQDRSLGHLLLRGWHWLTTRPSPTPAATAVRRPSPRAWRGAAAAHPAPSGRAAKALAAARVALDVVVVLAVLTFSVWQWQRVLALEGRALVLGLAASHRIPARSLVSSGDLEFRIDSTREPQQVFFNPARLEGRPMLRDVGPGLFLTEADVQSDRRLTVIACAALVPHGIVSNARVDVWRQVAGPEFKPVLRAVQFVALGPSPEPTVPGGVRAPQTGAKGSADSPEGLEALPDSPRKGMAYLLVPADSSPCPPGLGGSSPLLLTPVAVHSEARAEEPAPSSAGKAGKE